MRINDTKAIIMLIVLVTIFFGALEYSQPTLFTRGDNARFFLPNYIYNWRTVAEYNTIPQINFNQYMGQPWLAMGQTSVLYPPVYLSVIISMAVFQHPFYVIDIMVFLHLLLAVCTMFLLLRTIRLSIPISFLASLMYVTYPYTLVSSRAWVIWTVAIALFPLIFSMMILLIRKPQLKYAFGLAASQVFLFFQGYIQHTFMILIFEIIYIFLNVIIKRNSGGYRRIIKIFQFYVIAQLIFLLLSLPVLLPMIEAQQSSHFYGKPIPMTKFLNYRLTAKTFLRAQIFEFAPKQIKFASAQVYYVGPFLLILFLLFLNRKSRLQMRRYNTSSYAIMALVAFMLSTSFLEYLYHVPGFNMFRHAGKYFLCFIFFITIAIACIVQNISDAKKRTSIAILALMLFTIILNIIVAFKFINDDVDIHKLEQLPSFPLDTIIQKDSGRIFAFDTKTPPGQIDKNLANNFASVFDYLTIGGLMEFKSKLNHELSLKTYDNVYRGAFNNKVLDHLTKWSVRYIIIDKARHATTLNKFSQLEQLSLSKEGYTIYENKAAKPLVYSTKNPDIPIPFSFGANRLDVNILDLDSHELIISIASLPHFIIYSDGKIIGEVKSNNDPISINVPNNTQTISLRYVDPWFRIGSIVSIITLLIIVCWLFLTLVNKYTGHYFPFSRH